MPRRRTNLLSKQSERERATVHSARFELPFHLRLRYGGATDVGRAYELDGCDNGPLLIVGGGNSSGATNLPLALAAVDKDALFPAADLQALKEAPRQGAFHLLQSQFGHGPFLKEDGAIASGIAEFRHSLELA